MAIVFQTDKRSGITYAYEATYKWDSGKKQSRSTRKLIGRADENGNINPTDGRCRKDKLAAKRELAPVPCTRHLFCGATYFLDEISEATGLTKDLRACFPDTYKQMLSIAYYLVLEDQNPLYRFEKWGRIHKHPHGSPITSPRSSEFFPPLLINRFNSWRFAISSG